jgi:uncharacterized protein involved in outer membrane biogenesis
MWTGIVFLLLFVGAVAFIATLDWNRAKPYITAAVSKASGREFAIDGDLRVDLGWMSRIQASQIRFENAYWSKHPQMAEVGLVDVKINVRELLKWRLVLPSVNISGVKVFLEKNRDGRANWEFGGPSPEDAVVPEERTEFPVIEKLLISDSTLQFANHETNAQVELKLIRAEAEGFWELPVRLKAEGYYQKQPMKLSLDGGSYQSLRHPKEPYPLNINLVAGKLKANIAGNLIEPLAMKGEDVTLDVQGDDLANLYPLLRLVFPSTPAYRLKGRLVHEGGVWSFSNFSGRVGGSDLSGNIRVDLGPTPHVMKADLVSSMLDFKDLAGFVGGDPKNSKSDDPTKQSKAANAEENDRIFPDQRFDLEKLRTMDADVRLRARKILAPNLPIDDLNARMTLSDGVLSFTPATLGVANGRIEIYSTFDGSKQLPSVNIDTRFRQLDLKRFLGNSSFAEKTLGPIGGRIRLSGTGDSFRQLMATSSGNTFLLMSGGEISEMLLELAGLDVAGAVKVLVRGDKPVPIRCGLLDLQGKDGQMGVQGLVFDSGNTVIFGEGNIDLRDEKVNIVLTPVPKDFSPFSLRSFIRVNGRFKNISAFPDPIKTGTESLLAKVFNVFMMLAMSPLQPRDLAMGRDVNCDALIAQVQEKDPHGVVPSYTQTAAAQRSAGFDRQRDNDEGKVVNEANHYRE